MKDATIYYSVGALLYCPANNSTIANSIINQRFGAKFSLALCLEDTVRDDCVLEAEEILLHSLSQIISAREKKEFYIPKIFVRVRDAQQILRLSQRLGDIMEILTGFILPKFSTENADSYIDAVQQVNSHAIHPIYMMPIYENASLIDLRHRYEILYTLKEKLDSVESLVLNIRVGGNDLCHQFGFRRHSNETIYQIRPIADIFSDIITVYGRDYVVSGPVWEYYDGVDWKNGLMAELADDKLCGFIGKTVIYPSQIEVVNLAYQVSEKDYEDAKSILNWDKTSPSLVSGNVAGERMNEYKTHFNWALRTAMLAEVYGIYS